MAGDHAPEQCTLCPRKCGVDRHLAAGFCGAGDRVQVYRWGAHHGEEPPISGTAGSGTVFFSRCTMRCLYCQNYPWSQLGQGADIAVSELAERLTGLANQGVHNWNLVAPTPWLPQIVAALDGLHERGIRLPVVYNTSGYELPETLAWLDDYVDVYLTDLRYANAATAAEASATPDYVDVARTALMRMWRDKGPLRCDAHGIAERGVICRILVLPGRATEALASLRWLAETVGTDVAVSVMAQYTPAWKATETPSWNRGLTAGEYQPVADAVEDLGFTQGWVQELETETAAPLIGYNMPASEPAVAAAI